MMNYAKARAMMVEGQLRTNKLTDDTLTTRFAYLPREEFAPQEQAAMAYSDEECPLGHGRFLLEPMVLARLLQAAAIKPTDRVLDIAGGTGYVGALLSPLSSMYVLAESVPALRTRAETLLATYAPQGDTVVAANITSPLNGCPDYAPYDIILIQGALATSQPPATLTNQLAENGRLLFIRRMSPYTPGQAVLCHKTATGMTETILFGANTPFLPEAEPVPAFAL
jgi:protein-L-isoaspartate(D-aspartate) O-methyltransferase